MSVCPYCVYVNSDPYGLLLHIKATHKTFRARCRLCGKSVLAKEERKATTSIEKLSCPKCKKVKVGTESLKRHLTHCSLPKEYKCDACTYETNLKSNFYRHVKERHFKFNCNKCNKGFRTEYGFTHHKC